MKDKWSSAFGYIGSSIFHTGVAKWYAVISSIIFLIWLGRKVQAFRAMLLLRCTICQTVICQVWAFQIGFIQNESPKWSWAGIDNSNVRRWGAKPRDSIFPQLSLPSSGNMLVTGTIATCGPGQMPHHSSLPSTVIWPGSFSSYRENEKFKIQKSLHQSEV